VVWVEGIKRR